LPAEAIDGLAESTEYHFRIVASNAFGTSKGADRQFITPLGDQQDPQDEQDKDDQTQDTGQGQLPDTGECFIGSVIGAGRLF